MDVRLIETVANQLDVAAQLLSALDPIRARLALILTDNAVELLLHVEAEEAFSHSLRTNANESPPDCIREALGERFTPKVKYAQVAGLVDDNDAQFAREAHKFRWHAYHTGRFHDDVL